MSMWTPSPTVRASTSRSRFVLLMSTWDGEVILFPSLLIYQTDCRRS